ncbi:MAG TPA: hypothetical protein DIT25_02065 [Candidatus Moranbacteria bacterium]|nr:hypothetical protein [Candidatus Moranbacteria bacterium]
MKNNDKKTEYIVRKDLEGQTQILLAAFDSRFDKLDKHITDTRDELKRDINNVQTLIDGYVKAQESFRQEFEIMKSEFGQMKKIIKEKLGFEIKAA